MAKRRSFEEILNSEFRWPRQGDRAFVTSAKPVAIAPHCSSEKSESSSLVASLGGKDFQNFAFVVHGPPKVPCLAVDTDEYLVKVLAPVPI